MNQNESRLAQLEAGLRAVGRQNRTVERLDHFEAYLSSTPDRIQNFAVPLLPDPGDWTHAVSDLIALFGERERPLRLEFFDDLHPGLAGALTARGFTLARRDRVMSLEAGDLPSPPTQCLAGRAFDLDATDEALLRIYLQNQSVAYGGPGDESSLGWLPNFVSGLTTGDLMCAARMTGGDGYGVPIAGASMQIGGGVGELAGVWTAPTHRRRGYAIAICHHLLGRYFAEGHGRCWLSAAEDVQVLYRRLGFVAIGTQLNFE